MEKFKFSNRRNLVKYCPCGKSNHDGKFSPIEGFTKSGYCHSCTKFFNPDDKTIVEVFNKKEVPINIIQHDLELVEKKMLGNFKNNFIEFLRKIFPEDKVSEAIRKYLIGTWNDSEGVVVFWQIDQLEKVHHGKVMQFNPVSGKRSFRGNNVPYIDSVKFRLKLKNVKTEQCLFGLHLINDNTKVVALVEGEKTAVIMSILKPEYVWVSTGGKGGFKEIFLSPIKHCNIIAFPDKGEYEVWKRIALDLNKCGFKIKIDDWLENSDYPNKTDLADVLINEKKAEVHSLYWKSTNDWEFSSGSNEVYRIVQDRKIQKLELTKEESYKAIEYFIENNKDVMQIQTTFKDL